MHGVGHDHHVDAGFDRLGHQRLQRDAFHRQTEARHVSQVACVARDNHRQLVTVNLTMRGVDTGDNAVCLTHASDFAFLDNVHAHVGAGTGIAPSDRIVTRGARTFLPQRAQNGVTRAVDVHDRHQFLDALGRDELGLHALQRVGMRRALIAAHLMLGLGQHHDAAGRKHDVIVQILRHRLVQRTCLFIDRRRGILQVVRANDGGVTAGVPAAQPTFFDDRHIRDPEILAQIKCRGQPVAPSPYDHHIVFLLGFGRFPRPLPTGVIARGFPRNGKCRITSHAIPLFGLSVCVGFTPKRHDTIQDQRHLIGKRRHNPQIASLFRHADCRSPRSGVLRRRVAHYMG